MFLSPYKGVLPNSTPVAEAQILPDIIDESNQYRVKKLIGREKSQLCQEKISSDGENEPPHLGALLVEVEGLVENVVEVVVGAEKLAELSLQQTFSFLVINQVDCHLEKKMKPSKSECFWWGELNKADNND